MNALAYRDDKVRFSSLLKRELNKAGFTASRAARLTGVPSPTVWRWSAGRTLPGRTRSDPAEFWAFVEKLRLPAQPFLRFVPADSQRKGKILKVCPPPCGAARWAYPSELKKSNRKVKVDWAKRIAEGLCRRCVARKLLKSEKRMAALYGPHLSPKVRRLSLKGAQAGEKWAKSELARAFGADSTSREEQRDLVRRDVERQRSACKAPRPRRSMALLLRSLSPEQTATGPIHPRALRLGLCALCGLLVEESREPNTWITGTWHQFCLRAWLRFSGQYSRQFAKKKSSFVLPPSSPRKSGRPFKMETLSRSLTALLLYRAQVLGFSGGASITSSAQHAGVPRQDLAAQLERFLKLLPGDWRLVFRHVRPSTVASLQRLYELPVQLLHAVQDGQRTETIKWLLGHRMAVNEVSWITGVSEAEVLSLRAV
jgi:hypothetical protein